MLVFGVRVAVGVWCRCLVTLELMLVLVFGVRIAVGVRDAVGVWC